MNIDLTPAEVVRKLPSQKRSRERVERMLAAASALIAEKGSDALRMSEVAERAGVPIGSLYQFFPDKSAIVRTLGERVHAESRHCIVEAMTGVVDEAGFRRALAELYDTYYALFLAQPVMRDIWAAMQADRALAAVELAESRANGGILAAVLQRLRPDADLAMLEASAFLVMALGESTIRLAISVPRAEGDLLVERYKALALREFLSP